MAAFTKKQVAYYLLFILGLLLSGCANQLPPGGGEIDRIPPQIIEVYPQEGTTNFNDDYFELGFSEYVDKRSVKDAIFISPAVEGNLKFDWSGKYVRVYFPEKLKKDFTYVVTVGTDLVDYNNKNRMAESYILTFSTGDKIDKGVIKGKVYSEKSDGVMIFGYKVTDPDTVNPMKNKPDYVSQTGKDGKFKLMGLAPDVYRIFAVKDEYRDLIFQPEQDQIGEPFGDITLTPSDTLFSNLNFFLSAADTAKPRLFSAVMTDKFHILLNFSEPVDSNIFKSNNFSVSDSSSNFIIKPVYAFKGKTKTTEMVLALDSLLNEESNYIVIADTIIDKEGNTFLYDSVSLTVSDKPDTTSPEIIETIPRDNSAEVDYRHPSFSFFFNDGFDSTVAKTGISFSDTSGNKIAYKISFYDDASFIIQPVEDLLPIKAYVIKLDFNKFKDVAGNSIDSVYEYRFTTIRGLDFTGVSGKVYGFDSNKNPILVLQPVESTSKIYKLKIGENSKFDFKRIKAGKYTLWCFLDKDSSGTYTFGWPFPFKPSEKFSFYPDTLNLRPRWSLTDLNFNFDK